MRLHASRCVVPSQMHAMGCKTCEALLDAYNRCVRLYTKAVTKLLGTLGADSTTAHKDTEELRLACENAREAMMTHLSQDHGEGVSPDRDAA